MREETSAAGGEGQSGTFDEPEDCEARCLEEDDCVGFDWTLDEDADTRCWLHMDQDAIDDADIGGTDGVDQYVRGDCDDGNDYLYYLILFLKCHLMCHNQIHF